MFNLLNFFGEKAVLEVEQPKLVGLTI